MFCPNCGKEIGITDKFCPSCGCDVNAGVPRTTNAYNSGSSLPLKNVAVALILSVIIPGLGQIYCGRGSRGLVTLVVSFLALFLFGIIAIIIWIWNIYDAYKTASLYNEQLIKTGFPPW